MSLVRINPQDHHDLRAMAKAQGASLPEALHLAIKAWRRQLLLAEANAGYAALRADPEAWAAEQAERALWDRAELRETGPAYGAPPEAAPKPSPSSKPISRPAAKSVTKKSRRKSA